MVVSCPATIIVLENAPGQTVLSAKRHIMVCKKTNYYTVRHVDFLLMGMLCTCDGRDDETKKGKQSAPVPVTEPDGDQHVLQLACDISLNRRPSSHLPVYIRSQSQSPSPVTKSI